ncbi:hypothetical protein ABFA07_002346 [Porites harrisoni]
MSITLYEDEKSFTEGKGVTFTQSRANLLKDGKFTIADVKAGNWIFYERQDYHGPLVKTVRDVEKHVTISGVNGSVFLVENPELILFKDFGYRGERKWFHDNQEDLTGLFSAETEEGEDNKKSGVSSAILLSKNRSVVLFTEANFGGQKYTMQPGEWCEKVKFTDDHQAGQNDKWLSFKFI